MHQLRLFIQGAYCRVQLDERSSAWYLDLAPSEPLRLRRLAALLEACAASLEADGPPGSCSRPAPPAPSASPSPSPIPNTVSPDTPQRDILVRLLDTLTPEPSGVWSIEDAKKHIDLNFNRSYTVDFFVAKCALNSGDFSRRFKALTGCPLFEYINRQRVRRACVLLKTTEKTILEIAEQVGYNNLSFFNRYFLRIMGCTPSDYRKGRPR